MEAVVISKLTCMEIYLHQDSVSISARVNMYDYEKQEYFSHRLHRTTQ